MARQAALVVPSAGAILLYWQSLTVYLSSLSNPAPMQFVLCGSLVLALIYDFKGGIRYDTMVAVLVTCLVFAMAGVLAAEYRVIYLEAIEHLRGDAAFSQAVGEEYVRAVDNPAVGIGACFAMALASIRLPFRGVFHWLLMRAFFGQPDTAPCPHCGQLTASHSKA
jgi:hypothetical protein